MAIAVSAPPPPELGFVHRFVPGTNPSRPPLLLLHGTGGDENDLVPLGAELSPGSALISPLGKVREDGMPRFFRRFPNGTFDLEDLKSRTFELVDFIARARAAYGIAAPIALGYSNGANIAAAVMLLHPRVLAGAALLRAGLPLTPEPLPNLHRTPVLILSGAADTMIRPDRRDALAQVLSQAGADVTAVTVEAGHGLTQRDLDLAAQWLAHRTAG